MTSREDILSLDGDQIFKIINDLESLLTQMINKSNKITSNLRHRIPIEDYSVSELYLKQLKAERYLDDDL